MTRPSLAKVSAMLGAALIPAPVPPKSRIRSFKTFSRAEKYRDKLRAQWPERTFFMSLVPGTKLHCVVEVHPRTGNTIRWMS